MRQTEKYTLMYYESNGNMELETEPLFDKISKHKINLIEDVDRIQRNRLVKIKTYKPGTN
jgi:hypothetical protein